MEPRLTMWAWGAARSSGRKVRVTRNSPTTLVSIIACQSWSRPSATGSRPTPVPALLTSRSAWPWRAGTAGAGGRGGGGGGVEVEGQGGGADLLGQGLEAVGAAGAGDHVEAGPGQLAGAGRPDPAGGPGDDGDRLRRARRPAPPRRGGGRPSGG